MKVARATVEFFSKSIQAIDKLYTAQSNGSIQRYVGKTKPVKAIQDVVMRWWSSWRMLKRLRYLKPTIFCSRSLKKLM